jgi:hypothetical protein
MILLLDDLVLDVKRHHDEVYQIQLVNVINHLLLLIIFLLMHYVQFGRWKEARKINVLMLTKAEKK